MTRARLEASQRLAELRTRFSEGLPARLDEMDAAMAEIASDASEDERGRALDSLHHLAHKLAGTAGTFGFRELGRGASRLEEHLSGLKDGGRRVPPGAIGGAVSLLKSLRENCRPLARPATAGKTGNRRRWQEAAGGDKQFKQIMLAGDDEIRAQSIQSQLPQFGYQVTVATGLSGIASRLKEARPAALIMDIMFPEGDDAGMAAINALKAPAGELPCPVVVLSNRDDLATRLAAVRAGCGGYLVKPVVIEELVDNLDSLTGKAGEAGYRVLVVDDDEDTAGFNAGLLENAGVATEVVTDPAKIMGPLRALRPDVILMDINMPGCNGFELASVIRQDGRFVQTPIIFLTSEASDEQKYSAMRSGADDFLDKAVHADFLVASVLARAKRARDVDNLIARLSDSERRFRDYAESTADRFWETDEEHRITYLSPGIQDAEFPSVEQALGKRPWEREGFSSDQETMNNARADIEARRPFHNLHFTEIDIWGRTRHFRSHGTPVYDASGEFTGYRGTTSEFTAEFDAEAALKENEELFRRSFDDASIGMAMVDPKGEFLRINTAFCEMLGYEPDELAGHRPRDILHPDDQAKNMNAGAWLAEGKIPYFSAENRYIHNNGDVVWCLLRATLIRDGEGQPLYTINHIQDITERKLAEEALAESERTSAAMIEAIPDMMFRVSREGIIFDFRASNSIDPIQPPEVFLDRPLTALLPPHLVTPAMDAIKRAFQTGEVDVFEFPVIRANKTMYFEARNIACGEDEVLTLVRDITDRRIAEEELEKSKIGLDNAQRIARLGNWEVDIESGTHTWSDEQFRILGLRPGEREPSYEALFECVHPDDRASLKILRSKRELTANPIRSREYRIVRPDGQVRTVEGLSEVEFDGHGDPVRLSGTLQDITERKVAEEALEIARREAEYANRAKSEFLSSMSHELRTPMNAILGFGQLLKQNQKEPLTEAQRGYVRHILNSGHHLLDLINDVLNLSQIESGKTSLTLENFDPREVIEECLTSVGATADKSDIHLRDDTSGKTMPMVFADRVRLKQVLLNLLSNAVKYNSEGGSVTFACRHDDDDFVRFTVADTGLGIPAEKWQEIFEPFARLFGPETGIEGTGIGLTITKRLIEQMNGTIGLTSVVGEGSTFWVDVPRNDQATGRSERPQARSAPRENRAAAGAEASRTLLYVEDNPANLDLMEELVKHIPNLKMVSTHTGELGLEIAKSNALDVILLDINLPGIDGYAVLDELRNSPKTASIPVIALTAAAMPKDVEKGLKAGFHGYLTKPFEIEVIIEAIDGALSGS